MSLKVAMVYPLPSPISPQKNCPLSVIYPGRAAEEAGYEVDYWDARTDGDAQLWSLVERSDVVAVSSLSGYQLGESIQIASQCKERHPNKPIVWGGVHVTFQPVQSLGERFVDFCVLGEGEVRFVKLLRAIEWGKGYGAIDGIGYKRESAGYQSSSEENELFGAEDPYRPGLRLRPIGRGKEIIEIHDPHGVYESCGVRVRVNRRGLPVNLKEDYVHIVSPKTERLFLEAARRNEVILQTSRGCTWSPTSCEFCSVGGQYTQWDPETGKTRSVYRYIPFEQWAKDLDDIYSIHSFDYIILEDENSSWFVKDWRYAEHLKKRDVKYHIHLRSDQLKSEERVSKLADTGCVRIHIGAESGNQQTLDTMRKNERVDDHHAAARLLSKYGIEGVYTWIVGNPGETPTEIMDTLRVSDEIRALHPPAKSRATVYVLMPLPGTIAFERARENGWILPTSMEGWTEMSAAYNPKIPQWVNNIYLIAGFHHNRFHKTQQNFPGWWRLLILPFELLIEWRWNQGIRTARSIFFSFFGFEYWCIMKLVSWRSKRSTGDTWRYRSQVPKLLERLIPGLAGH